MREKRKKFQNLGGQCALASPTPHSGEDAFPLSHPVTYAYAFEVASYLQKYLWEPARIGRQADRLIKQRVTVLLLVLDL